MLAPEGASSHPTSCCLDYVPEGDNNEENYNRTASGLPCRKLRARRQYNPQSSIPSSQWVSNKYASVAEFLLDSTLDGTFSMDS